MRHVLSLVCCAAFLWSCATPPAHQALSHPRPSGYTEPQAAGQPARIDFQPATKDAGFTFDLVAHFPKEAAPEFDVQRVELNGTPHGEFVVRNQGVMNLHRHVHGSEDFSVSLLSGWTPGQQYAVKVTGVDGSGAPVTVEQQGQAPAERAAVRGLGFAFPSAEHPYHYATFTLAKEDLKPGTVTKVEVDGVRNRDARYFNTGKQIAGSHRGNDPALGETYTGEIEGGHDFSVIVPVNWTAGSAHTVKVTVQEEGGGERVYEETATAGTAGSYWNAAWPSFFSLTLHESAGIERRDEPVRVTLGAFMEDIGDPEKEIRVVTYDPTNPAAGADGYVVAPHQVLRTVVWNDQKMLTHEERDAATGELIHRYDATTTVELLFNADVLPYQNKVYQVLYGNPQAQAEPLKTPLYSRPISGLSQVIGNDYYELLTAANSGSGETITIKAGGEPVLLEHKLETNGAFQWNPDLYAPPTPWVHVSDWENPEFQKIDGPLMHYTRQYAPLPHMTSATASISYTFYAKQPYILFTSLMEVHEDLFASALRNMELVFNRQVLNEFVWLDKLGKVQHLHMDTSKKHPVHAIDIPPDTQWMAFVNRDKKVGFANIVLDYVNTNRYGDLSSETQPYIYPQSGPWVYFSRGIVYPFAGNNMTRLMPVRKGSMYYTKDAWLPFRFSEGDNPYAVIEETMKKLNNPLFVHEWMPTNKRAPEKWIMPLLTMPFDEGVHGAVTSNKEVKK